MPGQVLSLLLLLLYLGVLSIAHRARCRQCFANRTHVRKMHAHGPQVARPATFVIPPNEGAPIPPSCRPHVSPRLWTASLRATRAAGLAAQPNDFTRFAHTLGFFHDGASEEVTPTALGRRTTVNQVTTRC